MGLSFCSPGVNDISKQNPKSNSILKIEMNLNAFGVESDNFPSIDAYINFQKDSSNCIKSFYDPANKDSSYQLSKTEIKKIIKLLQDVNFRELKKEYTVGFTDQPTYTTMIYTIDSLYSIKDYGLQGDYPLQELYKIVYKL